MTGSEGTEATVNCRNCGHPNPEWAQTCRNCGKPLHADQRTPGRPGGPGLGSLGQSGMLALGAALGTIVLAVVAGLVLGGIVPAAPPPTPTPSPTPSATIEPSLEPSLEPTPSEVASAEPTPALPGTLTFGLGLDRNTKQVVNPTDTFSPGTIFAHSIQMPEPFGVGVLGEEVLRIEDDGSQTLVIDRNDNTVQVNAGSSIAGFAIDADLLINSPDLGPGTYLMRIYRGAELIAQGQFNLTN